ncbi:unnamed protein product, partial [Mesorhabditis spiculigera]
MFKTLKPENAYTKYPIHCQRVFDGIKGSLAIHIVEELEMDMLKGWRVKRLGFGYDDDGGLLQKFLMDYIDEWMACEREVEALWIRPEWHLPLDGSLYLGTVPYDLRADFQNTINKYALTIDAEGIVRGQLTRKKDGKVLKMRARETDIILQAPGANMCFLLDEDSHLVAPEF